MTLPVLLPAAERLGDLTLRWRGARARSVVTPAGRLQAYDMPGRGKLPTIALLHGLGSSATSFAPLLLRLQPAVRRLVAPDFPGHGFSPEPARPLTGAALVHAVTTALDSLLDEPSIVMGTSLGGAVALSYAIARPERVSALVLVSPAGARGTDEEWDALKSAFRLDSRADALTLLRRLHPRSLGLARLVAHELPAALSRPPIVDLLASVDNENTPSPEAIRALPMPVLLLWGRQERLLPPSHLAYFARHLPPHAKIERPVDFGHCPHVDSTEALAARMIDFAGSRAASTSPLSAGSRVHPSPPASDTL